MENGDHVRRFQRARRGVRIRAQELSRLQASKFLSRSLDLLHVAAARIATCTIFISADDRQLAVAKATGLAVIDIKRRAQRMKR